MAAVHSRVHSVIEGFICLLVSNMVVVEDGPLVEGVRLEPST